MASEYRPNFGLASITANTTLTAAAYAGFTLALNNSAGATVILPDATGSGVTFNFIVGTTAATGSYIIKVPDAANVMTGTAILFLDGGDTVSGFATAASTDTITLTGTTTGGINGATVKVTDIGANLWGVSVVSDASGSEATPFSATVS